MIKKLIIVDGTLGLMLAVRSTSLDGLMAMLAASAGAEKRRALRVADVWSVSVTTTHAVGVLRAPGGDGGAPATSTVDLPTVPDFFTFMSGVPPILFGDQWIARAAQSGTWLNLSVFARPSGAEFCAWLAAPDGPLAPVARELAAAGNMAVDASAPPPQFPPMSQLEIQTSSESAEHIRVVVTTELCTTYYTLYEPLLSLCIHAMRPAGALALPGTGAGAFTTICVATPSLVWFRFSD